MTVVGALKQGAQDTNSAARPALAAVKRAFATLVVTRYLDQRVSGLPMAKQASVRRIQLELAKGAGLVSAISAAQPGLDLSMAIKLAKQLASAAAKQARGAICSPAMAAPRQVSPQVFNGDPGIFLAAFGIGQLARQKWIALQIWAN